jgi:hypothetical protein
MMALSATALPGEAVAIPHANANANAEVEGEENCTLPGAENAPDWEDALASEVVGTLVPCAWLESGDFGNACPQAQPVMSAPAGFLLCLFDLDIARSESPPDSTLDPRNTHQQTGHGFGSAGASGCLSYVARFIPCARVDLDVPPAPRAWIADPDQRPPDPSG